MSSILTENCYKCGCQLKGQSSHTKQTILSINVQLFTEGLKCFTTNCTNSHNSVSVFWPFPGAHGLNMQNLCLTIDH